MQLADTVGFLDRLRGSSSPSPTKRPSGLSTLSEDLYDFGLFEIDPRVASPDLVARAGQLEPKYYHGAAADPAAFTAAVSRAAHERGSWATYGGMRLVNSLVGPDAHGSSDVFEMAFGFLRSRHINFFYLSPVEIDWWVRNHPGEDYLSPRPLPPRPFTITPLADGERRRLVNLGPHGNNNEIYAIARDGRFHSVVLHPGEDWRDAGTTESRESLEQLYERLGEIVKYPRPEIDPEFANFCPLQQPDFSP